MGVLIPRRIAGVLVADRDDPSDPDAQSGVGGVRASTFTSGDATPSVLDGDSFITAGSTAITNFDDGVEGQVITVYRGDSNIVITDNATIETILNANLTLTATQPMASFRKEGSVWKEVAADRVSSAMAPVVQATITSAVQQLDEGNTGDGIRRVNSTTYTHYANNLDVLMVRNDGGIRAFGLPTNFEDTFPNFRVDDDSGGNTIRAGKLLGCHPGDPFDLAFRATAGEPGGPVAAGAGGGWYPLQYNQLGGLVGGFLYWEYLSPKDAPSGSSDWALANTYRTIKPHRLTGASPWAITQWVPPALVTGYGSGHVIHVLFVSGSGTTPQINLNSYGNRALKRNNGDTPSVDYWPAGTECTFVDNGSEYRASSDSDSATGVTWRAGYENPNYSRAVKIGVRTAAAPTQTSRAANLTIQLGRGGETILRDRTWWSHLTGGVVFGGRASYEFGADIASWPPEYMYPGPLANSPTDPNYPGSEFAGSQGGHNGFNTHGTASAVVLMDRHTRAPGLELLKMGEIDYGIRFSYDHTNNRLLIERSKPNVSTINITGAANWTPNGTDPTGQIVLTLASSHGQAFPFIARVASVGGTTEANGKWTVRPVANDKVVIEGAEYEHAYTSGGTIAFADVDTLAVIDLSNDDIVFGGPIDQESLAVAPGVANGDFVRVVSQTAGNGASVRAVGNTNTPLNLESTGTSPVDVYTGAGARRAARFNNVNNSVNWMGFNPSATGNAVRLAAEGSDTDIDAIFVGKGAGRTGIAPPRSTTAALAAIGSAINTTNKFTGKLVINTTSGAFVTAAGSAAGDVWEALDGTTAHTPV